MQKIEGNQYDDYWIANLVLTTFTRWITETDPLFRFVAPKFDLFYGTTNPKENMIQYNNAMFLLGISEDRREAIMCKVFTTSLKWCSLSVVQQFKGRVDKFFLIVE